MEEVEDKPTSSESSSSRNDESNSLPETSQENTDIIIPTNNHSSIEASDDQTIGQNEHLLIDNPTSTPQETVRGQDEYILTDDSTSTPKETIDRTVDENLPIAAADSEPEEALEDFLSRKQDDGSTDTSSHDVDNNVRELSTSSSETKELQFDTKELITDSPITEVIDTYQENFASTPNVEVFVTEQSHQEQEPVGSSVENQSELLASTSEKEEFQIDPTELITDSPQTEAIDASQGNLASTPNVELNVTEPSHQEQEPVGSSVENQSELLASTSEKNELQIDPTELITDSTQTKVIDSPKENLASTPNVELHVSEQNHQEQEPVGSSVESQLELLASTSEKEELKIDPTELITDSPQTEVIDAPQGNLASTPNVEFNVTEQSHQEQEHVGSSVENQSELLASTSGKKELQIDPTELIADSPQTEVIDAPQGNVASTPNVEFYVTEQSHQEQEHAGNSVENQSELVDSASGKDLQNDQRELEVNLPQIKVSDAAVGGGVESPTTEKKNSAKRGIIDTAPPFESVKEAVSKFGGIVDWKAHRVVTVERRKQVEQDLEKAHEEIPEYRKRSYAAEQEKVKVLQELDSTKRLIEELKLNLERAQTEERQARQDSELAKLRVEEMEQGIAEDSSVAAKAQLEVAKARYTAAITELTSVKEELDALRVEYASLVDEKAEAVSKAKEAVAASKQVEKKVEDLTIELISTKESLESAHTAHMEAEEHRIGTVMARDQDFLNWEKELKEEEQELENINQKTLSAKDLNSKLFKASTLLLNLKAELNAYMESKSNQEEHMENKSHNEMEEAIASAKKELEEVKINIEKATSHVKNLKVAATSLRTELEQEKSSLALIRKSEGMASVTVVSMEAELNRTISEIGFVQMKEKDGRETIHEMPKKLQEAAEAANMANLLARETREVLRRAKEEAEQAKAGASTMNSRLLAAQKEIEAARASERLAIQAIKAMQESESARINNNNEVDLSKGVILSIEEYYNLTKQVHEAEEEANLRIATANSEIDVAKESELKTSEKLNEVNKEMAARRESLKTAMEKAEKARERKLKVEQELRKWRAEHGERRKAREKLVNQNTRNHSGKLDHQAHNSGSIHVSHFSSPKSNHIHANNENGSPLDAKSGKKKKKPFFPRLFMFFARRKSHPTHSG